LRFFGGLCREASLGCSEGIPQPTIESSFAVTPDRWRQVRAVFESVLAEPSTKARILAEECPADQSLRREVESLRSAYEEATGFLAGMDRRIACPGSQENLRIVFCDIILRDA
jgi:hypothetical protein